MVNLDKISFIGCGNMASAIIHGLIANGLAAANILASNRGQKKLEVIKHSTGIQITTDNIKAVNFSDILILAVKPQILPQVCQQLSCIDLSNKLIISIAAGITTDKISQLCNQKSPNQESYNQELSIVRAMSNTPATVSEAATGLYANSKTSASQKIQATKIFDAIGLSQWVEKESLIDVITAIAGSSPAYVFLFIQAMVDQAVKQGLEATTARKLATQAVLGASKLAQKQSDQSLENLQKAVTSPGGTTAAAIDSFEQDDFSNIIKKAVAAAITKGKELGEQT